MNVQWHLNLDTFSKTYDVSTVSITVGSRSTIVISGRDSSFDLQPWQKQCCSQFVILDP